MKAEDVKSYVLDLLAEHGPATISDLWPHAEGITKQQFQNCLQNMRKRDLVTGEKTGKNYTYRVWDRVKILPWPHIGTMSNLYRGLS